jgi:hypothetical protein
MRVIADSHLALRKRAFCFNAKRNFEGKTFDMVNVLFTVNFRIVKNYSNLERKSS